MATYYWVGGSGNWSDAANHWSNSSGGSPNASYLPTATDDVIFDANSNTGTGAFTVTVDGTSASPSLCRDFSTGGAGGALDGAMTLSMGATAVLDCYGSMTLPATNLTWSGTSGSNLYFQSTSTGKTVTTNGVTITGTNIVFNGSGGGWTLGSALTLTLVLRFYGGTFSTGNYNVTANAINIDTTTTKSVSFGSSTLTLSGTTAVNITNTTNLTFNAGTSTITCSAASPTFTGGGLTFYNVTFSSASSGTVTINGANTFNDLTQTSRSATGVRFIALAADQTVSGTLTLGASNTAIRRIQIASNTLGTRRTITLNGTLAALADIDFRDIGAAGSVATPWTGTRLADCLNNNNITFDAPKTVYWNLAGTQNWSATGWATTNNGVPAVNNFPLAQDTAVFTEAGSAGTVTLDAGWFIGSIQMADGVSNRTTAFTLTTSSNTVILGNVTLFSNLTFSGSNSCTFGGQGLTQTITSAGVSISPSLTINSINGTFKLADNLTNTGTAFTLTAGTLDLSSGNRTLTCVTFSSSNSNTRSISFGTGNITVTGNNTTVFAMATATGFTYTGTPVFNMTYSGSTGTRTLQFGSTAGATESNVPSINISAGTDIVGQSGSTKNLNLTGFAGTYQNFTRTIFGNLTIPASVTFNSGTNATTFAATSGTQQVTTNGVTLDFPITVNAPGATVQLQDNLTIGSTRTFTLTAGTLDLTGNSGNWTLSTGVFSTSVSTTRAIAFGTGNITLTGNNQAIWSSGTVTGFTVTGTPTVNCTYSGSTGTRTISSGQITPAINFNITAGSDTFAVGTATGFFGSIDFTGFSGTLTNTIRSIYGNLTISSGMTLTAGANATTFAATSGTQNITSAGQTMNFPVTINAPGATVKLIDALTLGSTRALTLTAGTFDTDSKNVTVGTFAGSGTTTRALTLGSSTFTVTGSGSTAWDTSDATNLTVSAGTSTISMTSSSAKTFSNSGVASYYILNQGGTGALTIGAATTFYSITNTTQPAIIYFPAGATVTVTTLGINGTAGNLLSLYSTSSGSVWNISSPSGTINVTYADIKDSNATGGASWYATSSTNGGNNTGWQFINPAFTTGNFLAFF